MNTHSGWYAGQAKTNPDLFRVIFDFNRRPQYWLHPEVVSALPEAPVVKALSQSGHGQGHLSAWLLGVFRLNDCEAVWDFQEPRRRLALLAPATLARLACHAGAALCWPRLAAIIGKQQIQEIKATLGEEAHSFALRRARLIVPEAETLNLDPGAVLSQHVLTAGWNLLAAAAGDEAEGIRRRLSLKLPPAVQEKINWTTEPDQRDCAWKRVRQISREVLTAGETKCFA